MPQIRGGASFLTNVKREVKPSMIKMDHSGVKLANSKIASGLESSLDRISLKEYRRRADAEHEIKLAREKAAIWSRMKGLTNQTSAVFKRPKSRMKSTDLYIAQAGEVSAKRQRERRAQLMAEFSSPDDDGSNPLLNQNRRPKTAFEKRNQQNDSFINPTRSQTSMGISQQSHVNIGANSEGVDHGISVQTANGRLMQARSAFKKGTTHRPRTAPGKTYNGNSSVSSLVDVVPGRSFQELKEMSHIDHLSSTDKENELLESQRRRSEVLLQDRRRIQERVDSFCKSIINECKREKLKEANKNGWMIEVTSLR